MQRKVDIGGRQLYIEVAGEGSPTVILEGGAGSPAETWDPIWPALTRITRLVRYDRLNLGQSDQDPSPRTAHDVATELDALLARAGLNGPYILVGHSFGGLFVRLFRDLYPARVAGLILLDASHHEQVERFSSLLPPVTPGEPPEVTSRRERYCNRGFRLDEGIIFWDSMKETAAVAPLGSLPLTVISRALLSTEDLSQNMPGPLDLAIANEGAWHEMQAGLARLSSNSSYIVAEQSGHFVHHDRPELVVQAIERMISQVQVGRVGRSGL